MKNLFKLTPQEIADFLLNNKKGNCLELVIGGEKTKDSSFVEIPIYKDKNVEILYSYLKVEDNDVIEQFTIYSKWWGKIKNSLFTLEGEHGNFKNLKSGVINLNELKYWNSGSNHEIHKRNKIVKIEIVDFSSLVNYCQRFYKMPPLYGRVKVLLEAPNSLVSVEIHMPDGKTYTARGTSKKNAGNNFAREFAKKINTVTAS